MLSMLALAAAPSLTLTLAALERSYKVDQPIRLSASVQNRGKSPLRWVGPLDSMFFGRSPSITLERKTPGGWSQVQLTVGICGNTNPLTAESFTVLKPNDRFEYLGKNAYYPSTMTDLSAPGTYTLRATMDTTAPLDNWIGGPLMPDAHEARKRELQSLYNEVPKLKIVSNVITIRVSK